MYVLLRVSGGLKHGLTLEGLDAELEGGDLTEERLLEFQQDSSYSMRRRRGGGARGREEESMAFDHISVQRKGERFYKI